MDIIELFMGRESPITLGVIDKEATIRRRPVRLDRTEICTDDIGIRVVLGHFDSPFTCSCADVKDAAWFRISYWGAEKVPAGQELEEVVHKGKAVLFFLVIWKRVLAVSVGVIAAAIFIVVVADGGGEGEVRTY
jgi:hypothetical protein